jgi:hypothetical protein
VQSCTFMAINMPQVHCIAAASAAADNRCCLPPTHTHTRTPPQLLLFTGWQCLSAVSNYCGLHNTGGCLAGWPLIPVESHVLKYYNIELGWYLHLMLKHALGVWVWVLFLGVIFKYHFVCHSHHIIIIMIFSSPPTTSPTTSTTHHPLLYMI